MTFKYTHLIWFFLFIGFFLLGMPLDGTIPSAVRSANTVSRELPQNYLDAIFWGSFYLVTATLCLRKLSQLLQIVASNWALFSLVAWLGLSSLWSANAVQAVSIWIQLVGSLTFAAAIVIYLHDHSYQILRVIALALTFSLILNVFVVMAIPSLSVNEMGRWAGVTGNANYLGSLAGVAALTSVVAFSDSESRFRRSFFGLAFCLSVYVLLQSDSVTSLVALSTALITYLLIRGPKGLAGGFIGKYVLLIFVIAISSLIFVQLTLDSAFELAGRDRGLTGRVGIWQSGIELVISRPFIGYGQGSDTMSLGVLFRATHFHNGFLEVTIKSGLIGISLLILWLVKAFKASLVGFKKYRDENAAIGAILIFSLMHNLAESSFGMARSPVWLALIISGMLVIRNQQLLKSSADGV